MGPPARPAGRTRPPGTDLDALLSKQTMLTLEATNAEVQAKYRDDKLVMQHDKTVTLHHWHVVSVFDNKSLGNEAFRVQGIMIPNPAWDTGLPVCDLHGHNAPLDRVCSLQLCIPCLESQHIEMAVDFFTKQCVHHLAEYC